MRIFAVRQSDARATQIAASRDNRAGTNTYSWYITPPVFADLTGDYKIRISGTNTSCLAESGIFTLTYDTAGDVNPSGPPDESPDQIDVAIQVGGLGEQRRILNDIQWDRFRVYIFVEAKILNRRPSGAPITLREIPCRWSLEVAENDGNSWRRYSEVPYIAPDDIQYLTGTFKMGPIQSGPGETRQIKIVYILYGAMGPSPSRSKERFRFSFELDPDRTLTDPNRNNNIAYSAVFRNPNFD